MDKLNLNEDDLDDMVDRTFDLEPYTSYNSLIEFLKSKPDRFKRQTSPKKKLFKIHDENDKLGRLKYVKEMLICIV